MSLKRRKYCQRCFFIIIEYTVNIYFVPQGHKSSTWVMPQGHKSELLKNLANFNIQFKYDS